MTTPERRGVSLPERAVTLVAFGYAWLLALAILLPAAGLAVHHALALTAALAAALAFRAWRRRRTAPRPDRAAVVETLLLALVLTIAGACAWTIEPPVTGEEALDLASARRFADGGPITFDNTSLLPGTRPVYLFQPYQLGVAMTARLTGTDPLVALVKLRTLIVPLALLCVYVLLRCLARSPVDAAAAFAVVLVFVAVDFPTWENNSLFPFVRRGGVVQGVCVPALMALIVMATRRHDRVDDDGHRRRRRLAAAAGLLLATLGTHPLEVFTVLCFAGAVALAALLGVDRGAERRAAIVVVLVLTTIATGYTLVHARAVPAVSRYEDLQKDATRARIADFMRDPLPAAAGRLSNGGRRLWTVTIPSTTTGIVGIAALPLTALAAPGAAGILALAIVPLGLVYVSPLGHEILALLTSPATVGDVNGYFGLTGLLALALCLGGAARAATEWLARSPRTPVQLAMLTAGGAVALAAAVGGLRLLAGSALWLAATRPAATVLIAAILAVITAAIARRARAEAGAAPTFAAGVVVLSGFLAAPLADAGRSFGGTLRPEQRTTILARLDEGAAAPSVLDWPRYYERLRVTLEPHVPVPRTVVDALRERLPPRSILLADPRFSCGLVVLLDAYCVNPERIYGHFFLTAAAYHDAYVGTDSAGGTRHPLFNTTWPMDARERRFLADEPFDFVLAAAEHASFIAMKLREMRVPHAAEPLDAGYVLFRRE